MKKFYLSLLLIIPLVVSAQKTERWINPNYNDNLFISTTLDSTYVFPEEKISKKVKEYKVISDQSIFRLRKDKVDKQTTWLVGDDTLAIVSYLKGRKQLLFTLTDGKQYRLIKLSRKKWVISHHDKPILSIGKQREGGNSYYFLTPEQADVNMAFLKPFAFAYLVSCREGRDIRTFGISVLALGAIVSSAATHKEELLQTFSSNL